MKDQQSEIDNERIAGGHYFLVLITCFVFPILTFPIVFFLLKSLLFNFIVIYLIKQILMGRAQPILRTLQHATEKFMPFGLNHVTCTAPCDMLETQRNDGEKVDIG